MFFIFFPPTTILLGFGWLRWVTWGHVPITRPSGTVAAVGDSLWSLGLGFAPQGPPAPGRLHRSISWAGTVHHLCDPPPYPLLSTFQPLTTLSLFLASRLKKKKEKPSKKPKNAWCSVFHLTCTKKPTEISVHKYRDVRLKRK